MYSYDPMPPVSPLRHLPSLPIIYTPLDIRRSDTITPTGRRPMEDDSDITPKPLRIKVKRSPSMPFRKKPKGGQDGKEKDKESKKGFLGMNFPPSPRARSSSAGVLDKDKDKGKSDKDGDPNDAHNPANGKAAGSSPGAARMAWLQRPAARQMASIPDHGEETDSSHHRGNFAPVERNHSEGYESRDSSSHAGEDACLLPYSDGHFAEGKNRKNAFMRRASSTSAKYDKTARQRLEQRRLGTANRVLEEGMPAKSPPKGWKQMAIDLFQGNTGTSAQAIKRANSRKRERSDSISSTKSILTYSTPPEVSPLESDATVGAEKHLGGSLPRNFAASGMWQLDGPDGSRHFSRDGRSTVPRGHVRNTSVLGIFEGNIGGKNRTRGQKCGKWRPPTLTVDLVVTPERDTLPIYSGQSAGQNGLWISVEIEGKVSSSGSGYAGQPQGVGMDVGVLMDLSPYTSRTSFSSMKSKAKRIVESMESARDRVAVMTFPCAVPNSVYTLNASGSVARQQLLEDIMTLSLPLTSLPPSSRNVKEAVMAAIRKLKAMPSDATRYPRADRSVHLFLLTSQLDDGAIDLLPEVFMGQVQIHILGIGSVFWPRNEMGSSGWCVPLSTLGPRPYNKDEQSEHKSVSVEEIISTLRTAVDLGEAQNVTVHLRRAGESRILEVIGETEYPRLVPGEKRSLLIKVHPGNPNPHNPTSESTEWSSVERQINAIQADLGVYETPLLSVTLAYSHSNHAPTTTLSVTRTARVSRYNEHSSWHSSPPPVHLRSPENSPKQSVSHEEYVHNLRSQKLASMYSNPDRAICEIEAISTTTPRRGGDMQGISRELSYRSRMEKRFSHTSATTPSTAVHRSNSRRLSSSSDATSEILPFWRDGELFVTSPFVPLPEEPLVRLGIEESDADADGEEELDEAGRIWRDMKVRKYGSANGGSGGRVRFSGDTGGGAGEYGRGGAGERGWDGVSGTVGSGGGKSLVTLRDVRETDFGPWRV
ncbi:hypothetical protein L873DRAFT_1795647 [Choiromyces venosus 120613-1]|uniref:VWFA domain-containing protein n=1 Tax=Choiromyces venosus 120613-1 TaxID=1336337 RepID=A0A3N4IWG0_9PEZI|nr:hypothetical protein L873DRAFT_1795647 [Choiromyces venosus 120613-1]